MVLSYKARQEIERLSENSKQDVKLFYEKFKEHPLISLIFILAFIISLVSLIFLPSWHVSHFGITNPKDLSDAENSHRATLAQIIGGGVLLLSLYFAWGNIKTAKDGQITDRYTRAIEQLGSDKLQIRLGGIYALERISRESKDDHWPIMEILTTYVRENACEIYKFKIGDIPSPDILAILNIIKRRNLNFIKVDDNKIFSGHPYFLDLHGTYLKGANLEGAHLEEADLTHADLSNSHFSGTDLLAADLKWTIFDNATLEFTILNSADLRYASFVNAYVEECSFIGAKLEQADFENAGLAVAILREADLKETNLTGAYLGGADLRGALNLSLDQLSKVKTLYGAKLDPKLEKTLRKNYPALFKEPDE